MNFVFFNHPESNANYDVALHHILPITLLTLQRFPHNRQDKLSEYIRRPFVDVVRTETHHTSPCALCRAELFLLSSLFLFLLTLNPKP